MKMYTIYHRPSDFPGVEYLVREVIIGGAISPFIGDVLGSAANLDDARDLVPLSADCCLARHESDDPVIVETWM
jgi:hypothetical protein